MNENHRCHKASSKRKRNVNNKKSDKKRRKSDRIREIMTEKMTVIWILGSIGIIAILLINIPHSCDYRRFCHIDIYANSPEFDCGIIYSRLSKYYHGNESYAYGSHAHIEAVACSDEVLSILEEKFNRTFDREKCHYTCCITDGECINGVAINHQGYWWE